MIESGLENRGAIRGEGLIMRNHERPKAFLGNPFMLGYGGDIFEADPFLGYRFPLGMVVGHRRFVTLSAVLRRAVEVKSVVLCLGDSSVSGWNGNVISYTRVPSSSSPFFTYSTFCQFLEEMTTASVVNAGVPGYSSLEGLRYAKSLLELFHQHKVVPLAVPIYFGNNDATYCLQGRVRRSRSQFSSQLELTPVESYRANLGELCTLIRAYGSRPILVVPLVNKRWPPGLRSSCFPGERVEAIACLRETRVRRMLLEAIRRWDEKDWDAAVELDLVLPRIKNRYLDALFMVSHDLDVPVIDVRDQIVSEEWFLDYCHPLGPANQLIARSIAREAGLAVEKRRNVTDPPESLLDRGKMALNAAIRDLRTLVLSNRGHEPDIYPFH